MNDFFEEFNTGVTRNMLWSVTVAVKHKAIKYNFFNLDNSARISLVFNVAAVCKL